MHVYRTVKLPCTYVRLMDTVMTARIVIIDESTSAASKLTLLLSSFSVVHSELMVTINANLSRSNLRDATLRHQR